MKTIQIARHHRNYLAIFLIAITPLGCRSSSLSMPGKNLFSWNREPNAATLAGNTRVPELPESPATKYDPAAIASVAAKSPTATNSALASTTPGASASSAYGYTASAPKTGLAATANGYQTGPYQVSPATSASTAVAGVAPGGLPNPYGGTFSGSMTAPTSGAADTSNLALPNSVASAISQGSGTSNPIAPSSYPSPGISDLPAYPFASAGPSGSNAAASAVSYSNASTGANLPAYPTLPTNLSGTDSSESALTKTATASADSSAYTGTSNLPTYSPGSTGRSTNYDFSGGDGSGATSLPPNTASSTLPLLR